jgi:hypothetical protein
MSAEPKVEYANIDDERVAKLLIIVEKAAAHTPKLSAIASEAMLELEAINAEVQKHQAERAAAQAEADAKVKAEVDAKTAAEAEAAAKAQAEADNKAKIGTVEINK